MEQKKSEDGEKEKLAKIVLDSSVVIKWFSQEEDTDRALIIREKFLDGENIIAVPDLQLYEIANALRYNNEIKKEEVNDAVESLIDLGLSIIVPTKEVMEAAIQAAYKFDITLYDAYFVALAKELEFVFITADEKLYEKLKILNYVVLLKHYKVT